MAISAFNTNMFLPIFARLSTGFCLWPYLRRFLKGKMSLPTVIEYCYRGEEIHSIFFDIDNMPQCCCFLQLRTTTLFKNEETDS